MESLPFPPWLPILLPFKAPSPDLRPQPGILLAPRVTALLSCLSLPPHQTTNASPHNLATFLPPPTSAWHSFHNHYLSASKVPESYFTFKGKESFKSKDILDSTSSVTPPQPTIPVTPRSPPISTLGHPSCPRAHVLPESSLSSRPSLPYSWPDLL